MALNQVPESVAEIVSGVAPAIRAGRAAGDRDRQLPAEEIAAMKDAKLFRTWVPAAFGGQETDPLTSLSLFEEVARVDGSAGWLVSNCSFATYVCQVFPDQCVTEVFGSPDVVVAGSFVPPGTFVEAEGGYRLSGQWSFGSGSKYADWLISLGLLVEDGAPKLGPDGGPMLALFMFPAAEATIIETWRTLGMRGTGSNDYKAEDLFVPSHRAVFMAPWTNPASAFNGPLYRFATWMDPLRIAATALGIARGALDDFLEIAAGKVPAYSQTLLAERATVQDSVARARALIEAGHAYLHAAAAGAWEMVQDGTRPGPETGVSLGLSATFGMDCAVRAGDLLYELAGSTAFRDENPIQQRFRDLQTLRQNTFTSTARFENLGKLILGRPSEWAFHYL